MEYYRRQPPPDLMPEHLESSTTAAVDDATRSLRRLLPFPSADASSTRAPLMPMRSHRIAQSMAPAGIPAEPVQQAATIVSEAASILDEEMAKGVLAARGAKPLPRQGDADPSSAALRQVHDVIDNLARMWSNAPGASAPWPDASGPAASTGDPDPLPHLKPASVLRPGQRGTIAMMLWNKENRAVRLTAVPTDLISSTGGRIAAALLEFAPRDVQLEPGEQKEMQGRITVPLESAAGCYAGLLVVTGVDYLRALITIEVG